MKKLRKIAAILFALVLLAGATGLGINGTQAWGNDLTVNAQSDSFIQTDKYGTWELAFIDDNSPSSGMVIVSFEPGEDVTTVITPNVFKVGEETYRVSAIGDNFLKDNNHIKNVYVSNNVKTIGDYFCSGASKLQFARMSEGIETIGIYAFYTCLSMNEFVYNGFDLSSLGYGSFWDNKWLDTYHENNPSAEAVVMGNLLYRYFGNVSTVDFSNRICGNHILYIHDYAFSANNYQFAESITSVKLYGIKSISKRAFYKCMNLVNVYVDESSLESVAPDAFQPTINVRCLYETEDNGKLSYSDDYGVWQYEDTKDAKGIKLLNLIPSAEIVIMPDEIDGKPVVSIGDDFLWRNSTVKEITFSNNITEIGDACCCNTSIEKVVMSEKIKTIGDYAFYQCYAMNSFTYNGNALEKIGFYSFTCNGWADSYFENNPNAEALIIGKVLCKYYKDSEAIDFSKPLCGKKIEFISDYAFYNYQYEKSLKSVNFNGIKGIGEGAFISCVNLRSIDFGSTLSEIESNVFSKYTSAAIIAKTEPIDNCILLGNVLYKYIDTPEEEPAEEVSEEAATDVVAEKTVEKNNTVADLTKVNGGKIKCIATGAFNETGITEICLPAKSSLKIADKAFKSDISAIYYGEAAPENLISYKNMKNPEIDELIKNNIGGFAGCEAMKKILIEYAENVFNELDIKYRGGVADDIPPTEQVRIAGALYRYVIKTTLYNFDMNSAYGENSLLYGEGACGGFASKYAILLELAGIDAECAKGPGHGWVVLNIGGSWYHTDPTQCDQFKWFLRNTEEISKLGGYVYEGIATDSYLQNYGFTEEDKKTPECNALMGDINRKGRSDGADYSKLLDYLKGCLEFVEEELARADLNGDGKVNGIDALLMFTRINQ